MEATEVMVVTEIGVMVVIDTEIVTEAMTGTEVGTDMGIVIEDTEGTGIVDMVVIETEGMVATDMMTEVSVK